MKIAIIGCGVMGSALARHLAKKHQVVLFNRSPGKAQALAEEIGAVCQEGIADCEIVILAVKPKDLSSVVLKLQGCNSLLISLLAGTSLASLKEHFPSARLIRMMPNLGILCGQGVIGLCSDEKGATDLLWEGLGRVVWLDEVGLDRLGALVGSGIGFVFQWMEAMIEAGVFLGFSAAEAQELVALTIAGAAALQQASGQHPVLLKLQVASPGGMTIAGLKEMQDRGVQSAIINGVVAAYDKSVGKVCK